MQRKNSISSLSNRFTYNKNYVNSKLTKVIRSSKDYNKIITKRALHLFFIGKNIAVVFYQLKKSHMIIRLWRSNCIFTHILNKKKITS